MGYPMAGHLVAAGHTVTVWNRTAEVATRWAAEHEGVAAGSHASAVEDADIVFLCVGRDEDVLTVAEPTIAAMTPGSIFIDHTTTSADCARKVAGWCAARDIAFMDAPISGGQAGAENGALTIMCGSDPATFERAAPIMDAYAKRMTRIGPVGAGQQAKMMNQICIAGILQGLSEAIAFGRAAGLDIPTVIEAISGGAAQSWQMDNRALTMADDTYDFGFALDWMRKDLGYAIAAAQALDIDMPVAQQVLGNYDELSKEGHGSLDTSALLMRY